MTGERQYTWTDDPMISGIKQCNTDIVNDCLMHLKYEQTNDAIQNMYMTGQQVETQTRGLEQLKEMAHSTFDLSKFTVVGSPIITNDGLVSGYSSSNVVRADYQIGYLYNKSWTVSNVFRYNNTLTASTPFFAFANQISYGGVGISTSNGIVFQSRFGDSTAEITAIRLTSFLSNATIGNRYKVTLNFNINTGLYTLSYKGLDDSISDTGTYTPTTTDKQIRSVYLQSTDLIRAAGGVGWTGNTYSIDLKQFSITVDGVEVFSGNKTGIDTIKPDNYTVVDTPTISADGIIQCTNDLSKNKYLTKSISIVPQREFEIDFRYEKKINPDNTESFHYGLITFTQGNNAYFCCYMTQGGRIVVRQVTKASEDATTFSYQNPTNIANGWHDIKIIYKEGYLKLYIDNSLQINQEVALSNISFGDSMQIRSNTKNSWLAYNAIDLNSFKIYVDGNLVYQPCLKIPYTESKTGSKIVQSVYRNRVSDMYEQFGYAPYYTLSDIDFTLPQGEVYGMIERNASLSNNQIGLPIATLSNTLNDNEIWLEGAEVSKKAYAKLYAIYGDNYGTPDVNTNFVLPNFTDRVMQGISSGTAFGYIGAGLPNIMGGFASINNGTRSGAFEKQGTDIIAADGGGGMSFAQTSFDASRSSSIYGNSTTVQPPAIKIRVKTRYI